MDNQIEARVEKPRSGASVAAGLKEPEHEA